MSLSRRTFLGGALALAGHNFIPAAPALPAAAPAVAELSMGTDLWAQKTPGEVRADIAALIAMWQRQIAIELQVPEHMLTGQPRPMPGGITWE